MSGTEDAGRAARFQAGLAIHQVRPSDALCRAIHVRLQAADHSHRRDITASPRPRLPSTLPYILPVQGLCNLVVRGRIELPTFRFSGGFAGLGQSTTVQLTGPYDALAPVGVQNRPHVSGTVVSKALARSAMG